MNRDWERELRDLCDRHGEQTVINALLRVYAMDGRPIWINGRTYVMADQATSSRATWFVVS